MPVKTSAAAVANAFLDLQAQDHGTYPPIDQMKIQKLVFYAHAWSLALRDKPLFEDDVEAWPWGPVTRDTYLAFKDFGRAPIDQSHRATEVVIRNGTARVTTPPPPCEEDMGIIRAVWESHKKLSGVQLSNATHASGEPWTIVSDLYGGDLSDKPRIPNELIANVFKSKIRK